jgi:hypothetical protein
MARRLRARPTTVLRGGSRPASRPAPSGVGTLVALETLLFAALFENPLPFIGGAILAILVLVQAAKTRSKATVVVTGILLVLAIPFALWLFLIWAFSQDHS